MAYYHRVFKEGLNGFWMDKSLYLARKHDNCLSKRVGSEAMIDAWAAISKEWKGIDQTGDVRKLCMERMWDLASSNRVKGHFFKWLNECFVMLYRFPQQFCSFLDLITSDLKTLKNVRVKPGVFCIFLPHVPLPH